jgi:hypothetical protein
MMDDRHEPAPPALRVSDSDRDKALDVLAAGLAEGRLDPPEHATRTQQALQARTTTELAALTADLPTPAPTRADQHRKDVHDWLAEWRYWLGGAVILSTAWAARCAQRGELTPYWPVTPLGVWAAVLIALAIWPRGSDDTED